MAPSNLSRHVRQCHLNETQECPHCNRPLSMSNLTKHIKMVHMKVMQTCDICNEDFKYSVLSVHRRHVHGIGKPVDEVKHRGPNMKLRKTRMCAINS